MIHLDTSFLIRALVRGSAEDIQLRGWLSGGTPIRISTVAWAEFLCGPVGPREIDLARRLFPDPVPLMAADAAEAARLFNASGRRRGTLIDCMVAAIALREQGHLATTNRTDFQRLEAAGLRLADS